MGNIIVIVCIRGISVSVFTGDDVLLLDLLVVFEDRVTESTGILLIILTILALRLRCL